MTDLVTQPDATPTRKVGAVGVAGAVAILLSFFFDLPTEVATALTTVLLFTAGYFVRDRG